MGGGVGPLTGEHGLLIDSLLSVEMVTGSGEILTASATENSDLFWGMRGAGFNFGVVTSATYRIYDTINDGMVYNADMSFEAEKNATIFEIFQTYQGKQDDKLALTIGSSIKNKVVSASHVWLDIWLLLTHCQANNRCLRHLLRQQAARRRRDQVVHQPEAILQ